MKTSARSGIRCRVRRGIVGIQIESLSSTGYLEWKYKEDSPRIDRTCEQQFNKLRFILFFSFLFFNSLQFEETNWSLS